MCFSAEADGPDKKIREYHGLARWWLGTWCARAASAICACGSDDANEGFVPAPIPAACCYWRQGVAWGAATAANSSAAACHVQLACRNCYSRCCASQTVRRDGEFLSVSRCSGLKRVRRMHRDRGATRQRHYQGEKKEKKHIGSRASGGGPVER